MLTDVMIAFEKLIVARIESDTHKTKIVLNKENTPWASSRGRATENICDFDGFKRSSFLNNYRFKKAIQPHRTSQDFF